MATDDSSWQHVRNSGFWFLPYATIDSCSPRKLEPGFAAMYSKSSDLNTSTMKSDPGFSTVRSAGVSGASGSVSADSAAAEGAGAFPREGGADATCATPAAGVTSVAAPAA